METRSGTQFWANAAAVLEQRGHSVRWLALRTGISPASLSRYGSGTLPSIEVAARIATELSLSLDLLVFGSTEQVIRADRISPEGRPATAVEDLEDQAGVRLVRELGLGRLAQLAENASSKTDEAVLGCLTSRYPAGLTQTEIQAYVVARSSGSTPQDIATSLMSLSTRKLVEEIDSTPRAYRSAGKDVEVRYRDTREAASVVLEVVKCLSREIFPTVQKDPSRATLAMRRFKVAPQRARELRRTLSRPLLDLNPDFDNGDSGDSAIAIHCVATIKENISD